LKTGKAIPFLGVYVQTAPPNYLHDAFTHGLLVLSELFTALCTDGAVHPLDVTITRIGSVCLFNVVIRCGLGCSRHIPAKSYRETVAFG
jgi:hypothetical protein